MDQPREQRTTRPARTEKQQRRATLPGRLEWVVWPARRALWVGVGVLVFIGALTVAVYGVMESWGYAAMTSVVLIIAVLPWYLPAHYLLDESGVEVRSLLGNRHKAWESLKAYFPDAERGVLLSPVPRFGLVARTRGIYLPFQDNAAEVMRRVERHLKRGE